MGEYKMCPNTETAIYILDFIKSEYEKRYKDCGVQKYIEALEMGIDALKIQQTVNVEEVKHAKWVKGFCSNCGQLNPTSRLNEWTLEFEDKYLLYCPNCGAKMDSQL